MSAASSLTLQTSLAAAQALCRTVATLRRAQSTPAFGNDDEMVTAPSDTAADRSNNSNKTVNAANIPTTISTQSHSHSHGSDGSINGVFTSTLERSPQASTFQTSSDKAAEQHQPQQIHQQHLPKQLQLQLHNSIEFDSTNNNTNIHIGSSGSSTVAMSVLAPVPEHEHENEHEHEQAVEQGLVPLATITKITPTSLAVPPSPSPALATAPAPAPAFAPTSTLDSNKPNPLRFGCAHYKRRAMFVTPCCNKFYKCRFCHDENESHHFDRKTLTELICSECATRQKVQEICEKCGVRFGKYTCLICNLFDDTDKQQYHCEGCGICRVGGRQNFFHCEVCNMCLPIQLKIDGHRCVENMSRSHCPVCLGDIHTSRIPCHIPDCGHLLHKMCFDQLLNSGHYTCPTCQTSLIDMTALWDYLDVEALRMPIPKKYENQRIHIFCNDCHKTSNTKFHFIGLKCIFCGAYNTTQDVKRRRSLVAEEPGSA